MKSYMNSKCTIHSHVSARHLLVALTQNHLGLNSTSFNLTDTVYKKDPKALEMHERVFLVPRNACTLNPNLLCTCQWQSCVYKVRSTHMLTVLSSYPPTSHWTTEASQISTESKTLTRTLRI